MQVMTLGAVDYRATEQAMRDFTAARDADTLDQLWLCEHPPVYTQGVAGRAEHVHGDADEDGDIPVVATNRGGQVTYHGPGQVVAYPLVDLRRLGLHVKEYVHRLEAAALNTLADYGVVGHRVRGAPGVFVRLADPHGHAVLKADARDGFEGLGKIAALGIKVSRHCAYHGLALNVAMDLRPFGRIDPCGYAGLATVDLAKLGVSTDWHDAAARLARRLVSQLEP